MAAPSSDGRYDVWYEAGRDDLDYGGDPELAMYLEGAYQAALHVARWLVAPLAFEYTLLYNGSFWSPRLAGVFGGQFLIESEPEVPSVSHSAHTLCAPLPTPFPIPSVRCPRCSTACTPRCTNGCAPTTRPTCTRRHSHPLSTPPLHAFLTWQARSS